MTWFSDLFATEEEAASANAQVVAHASEILDVADRPYFKRFQEYLEAESDRPVKIGDQTSMLESAVRANTFKEVRAKIRKDIATAKNVIEEIKRGS